MLLRSRQTQSGVFSDGAVAVQEQAGGRDTTRHVKTRCSTTKPGPRASSFEAQAETELETVSQALKVKGELHPAGLLDLDGIEFIHTLQ